MIDEKGKGKRAGKGKQGGIKEIRGDVKKGKNNKEKKREKEWWKAFNVLE